MGRTSTITVAFWIIVVSYRPFGQVTSYATARETELGDRTTLRLYLLLHVELNSHITALGQISDVNGSLERTFLSPAHQQSRIQIASWMQEAGMHTWTDAVANVHGRIDGQNPDSPVLLIGSHYDTVKDAGQYDGAMGILVGIAAIKALIVQRAADANLLSSQQADAIASGAQHVTDLLDAARINTLFSNPVEVVAFCDEEGIRFGTTFLGSRALVGTLVQPSNLLHQQGSDGLSVQQVLEQHGFNPTWDAIHAIALAPTQMRVSAVSWLKHKDALQGGCNAQVKAYLEFHLEQGPVLEVSQKPLGVVSAIAGQTRLAVSMIGTQGHAGTIPMAIRRDPLAAAAEAITAIERQCQGGRLNVRADEAGDEEEQAASGSGTDASLVCTVGSILVWPGASNVIPGSANFSVDIRAQHDSVRDAVVPDVISHMKQICARRQLTCLIERVHDAGAVQCSPALVQGLTRAVQESETVYRAAQAAAGVLSSTTEQWSTLTPAQSNMADQVCSPASDTEARQCKGSQPDEVPVLVSGAGHDSLAMAELTQIGMVFVRCRGGISHSPLEHVSEDDVGRATAALFTYLRQAV